MGSLSVSFAICTFHPPFWHFSIFFISSFFYAPCSADKKYKDEAFNTTITEEDLATLEPGIWLNDEV